MLSASERAGFRGMLAKLERIEEIWLPRVGKDPWTIDQYVWELNSGLYRPEPDTGFLGRTPNSSLLLLL